MIGADPRMHNSESVIAILDSLEVPSGVIVGDGRAELAWRIAAARPDRFTSDWSSSTARAPASPIRMA